MRERQYEGEKNKRRWNKREREYEGKRKREYEGGII